MLSSVDLRVKSCGFDFLGGDGSCGNLQDGRVSSEAKIPDGPGILFGEIQRMFRLITRLGHC